MLYHAIMLSNIINFNKKKLVDIYFLKNLPIILFVLYFFFYRFNFKKVFKITMLFNTVHFYMNLISYSKRIWIYRAPRVFFLKCELSWLSKLAFVFGLLKNQIINEISLLYIYKVATITGVDK